MEINEKRVIELLLGLILVALLLIASIIVINNQNNSNSEINTISNSYNVNSYNNYVQPINRQVIDTNVEYLYLIDRQENRDRDYSGCRTWDYSSYKKQSKRQDFLGSYVNEYKVYVTNKGCSGEYFKVKFNFEYQNGFEISEDVTLYIKPNEKREFKYKDIQFERREVRNWYYDVKKANF